MFQMTQNLEGPLKQQTKYLTDLQKETMLESNTSKKVKKSLTSTKVGKLEI